MTPIKGLDGVRAVRTSPPEQASVLEAEPVQASTVTGVQTVRTIACVWKKD